MGKQKVLIIQSFLSNGGMAEYANIFSMAYGDKSEKFILYLDHYWKNTFKIFFGWNKKRVNSLIEKSKNFSFLHFTDNAIFDFVIINRLLKKTTCIILYTMHDPIPHQEKHFLKRIINTITKIKNNYLLNKASQNFIIHVHSKKLIPYQYRNSKYIINFPHPLSNVNQNVEDVFNIRSMSKLTISFVGRIEYYKGVDLFLDSIKEIDDLIKIKLNVIIAGSGQENIIIPETKNISINRFNYFLSNDELDSIIKYSDAIILPYRTATASGIITRAIPLNTPVICSDEGCLTEYIHDKKNGLLIRDGKKISNVILEFIRLKEDRGFELINNRNHPFTADLICGKMIEKCLELNS